MSMHLVKHWERQIRERRLAVFSRLLAYVDDVSKRHEQKHKTDKRGRHFTGTQCIHYMTKRKTEK